MPRKDTLLQPNATASQIAQTGKKLALVLIMLITAAVAGPVSFSQSVPAGPETHPSRKFSIGYLSEGTDIPGATARMELLQRILTHREDFRTALKAAGYTGVILSPCEYPRDMVQRMIDGEFDLVFATAMVYAQRPWTDYEPILQFKLPGDYLLQAADPDSGVFRQGVIFAGPSCPLFNQKAEPTPKEDLRRLFTRVPLAVPSADSAAGYLSPRYVMVKELGLQTILTPLFCGSDAEVVKHVVSGMVEVGACRMEVLKELIPEHPESFYHILSRTVPMPTDPILLRRQLLPVSSELGIKIKALLRGEEIFSKPVSVASASPRNYESLVNEIKEIQKSRMVSVPVGIEAPIATPAPTPVPVATASPTPNPTAVATPAATPKPALPSPAPPPPPAQEMHPVLPPMGTPSSPARPEGETRYAPPERPGPAVPGGALPPLATPGAPLPGSSTPQPSPTPPAAPTAAPTPNAETPQPVLPPARGGV